MSAEINEPAIHGTSELPAGRELPLASGNGPQSSLSPESEAAPRRQPIRLLSPRRTDIYFLRR
jgi:hypothetical protein